MGKNKQQQWEQYNTLPKDAIRVSEYAKEWPCNTSYLYKLAKLGKNKTFKIIEFQGINFILPQ